MKDHTGTDIPIQVLKALQLYSDKQSNKVLIYGSLCFTVVLYMEVMAILQFTSSMGDITKLVDNIEFLIGMLQVLIKTFMFVLQQDRLQKLLSNKKSFWETSTCSEEYRLTLDKLRCNTVHLQRLFICSMVICEFVLDLHTLFTGRRLPLGDWTLQGHDSLYKSMLITQLISFPYMGSFIATFDCLFVGFTIETIIQFRIVCYCLKELNLTNMKAKISVNEYYPKLTLCIQHHSFLLRFLKSLQDYFSGGILAEYLTISSCICAEMYALFESVDVESIVKHLVVGTCLIIQLGFYCFIAQMVSNEALAIGDAIYDSNWYSNHFSIIKHPVTLLIQRSQQKFSFSAGGLIDINIGTMLTVLRVSYSACTVMRGLKHKY